MPPNVLSDRIALVAAALMVSVTVFAKLLVFIDSGVIDEIYDESSKMDF